MCGSQNCWKNQRNSFQNKLFRKNSPKSHLRTGLPREPRPRPTTRKLQPSCRPQNHPLPPRSGSCRSVRKAPWKPECVLTTRAPASLPHLHNAASSRAGLSPSAYIALCESEQQVNVQQEKAKLHGTCRQGVWEPCMWAFQLLSTRKPSKSSSEETRVSTTKDIT